MNNEIWKPVKGFEDTYEVSNTGKVRSIDRDITFMKNGKLHTNHYKGRELSQSKVGGNSYWKTQGQYNMVALGNGKLRYVHRLVADAFCEKPDYECEVNHINGKKTDNRACNLEWITHRRNCMQSPHPETKQHTDYWDAELHNSYHKYVNKNKKLADMYAKRNQSLRWGVEYYKDYLTEEEKDNISYQITDNIRRKKHFNRLARTSFKEYANE